MAKIKRTDWMICGRVIGKASGWDGDNFSLQLYDFQPHAEYKGPISDTVGIDFEKGTIKIYDEKGEIVASQDLLEAIENCPKRK